MTDPSSGSTASKRTTFKLSLLDNGLDFLREGLEAFEPEGTAEGREQKYALLHIFSGLLLVLKERLRREHPAFVFVKVTDVGSPDPSVCRTVDFDETLARIRTLAGIAIDKTDLDLLRKAQLARNKIEHSDCVLTVDESCKLVGALIAFVHDFMAEHLGVQLEDRLGPHVYIKLTRIEEVAKRLLEKEAHETKLRIAKFAALSESDLLALRNEYDCLGDDCDECGGYDVVLTRGILVCTDPECRMVREASQCIRCGQLCLKDFCDDCQGDAERHMAD